MSTIISKSEVKKHKDKGSLWFIIRDEVYDVTKFIEEHPGGEDTLLEVAGTDATTAFDDVGHSEDARELLVKYKIGKLPESETSKAKAGSGIECSKYKYLALATALIGAIAIGTVLYKKSM